MESWTLYLIAGIIIFTITLMRLHFKRKKREMAKFVRRKAAAQAAREEQEKTMAKMGKSAKHKTTSLPSTQTGRMPLPDTVGMTFTGSALPANIARWETEVHEIGRQIMGKIDSKMVALQTLTLEAQRAANRMELLLERFETMAGTLARPQATPLTEPATLENKEIAQKNENEEHARNILQAGQTVELEQVTNWSGVVNDQKATTNGSGELQSNSKYTIKSYTDILNDLESEIDDLAETEVPRFDTTSDAAAPVTVLKVADLNSDGLSLSSPSLPGEKPAGTPRESLSLNSLYDNDLAERSGTVPFAVAGSHLDLRKQVEMMADYGYTPRQIAQSLNITQGEVDLMLSLRG